MKNILVFLVILPFLASCHIKDNQETYALLDTYMQEHLSNGHEVFLIDESRLLWKDSINQLFCENKASPGQLLSFTHLGITVKEEIISFKSQALCSKKNYKPIKFSCLKANELGLQLVSKSNSSYIKKHIRNEGKPQFLYEISRPVFWDDHENAFIIIDKYAPEEYSKEMLIFHKVNGNWYKAAAVKPKATAPTSLSDDTLYLSSAYAQLSF